MVLLRHRKQRVHALLTFIQGIFTVVSAAIGAASKTDASLVWPWLISIVQAVQFSAFYAIPVLVLSTAAIQWLKNRIGNPKAWTGIHKMLDEIRDLALPDETEDHAHRVTLFRHQPCACHWHVLFSGKWFRGWLVPVERSGQKTQRPNSVFFAPADAPDQSEGFAGLVFRKNGCFSVTELPLMGNGSSVQERDDYCKKTCSDRTKLERDIKRGKALARSFWGVPIEVNGNFWGVIVLDSRCERIPSMERLEKKIEPYQAAISRLIETL
jgi:hypothetical protein